MCVHLCACACICVHVPASVCMCLHVCACACMCVHVPDLMPYPITVAMKKPSLSLWSRLTVCFIFLYFFMVSVSEMPPLPLPLPFRPPLPHIECKTFSLKNHGYYDVTYVSFNTNLSLCSGKKNPYKITLAHLVIFYYCFYWGCFLVNFQLTYSCVYIIYQNPHSVMRYTTRLVFVITVSN